MRERRGPRVSGGGRGLGQRPVPSSEQDGEGEPASIPHSPKALHLHNGNFFKNKLYQFIINWEIARNSIVTQNDL